MNMVKYFFTVAIGTWIAFQGALQAQEEFVPVCGSHSKQKCSEYDRLNYVKLGAGSKVSSSSTPLVGPAIGIGRRYEMGELGVDISANYSQSAKDSYYFSIPRIMLLRFVQPNSASSLYAGIGGSLGSIATRGKDVEKVAFVDGEEITHIVKQHDRFIGLLGELCVGYEFCRDKPIRSFIELSAAQGAISFDAKQPYKFNPIISLTYGIGF